MKRIARFISIAVLTLVLALVAVLGPSKPAMADDTLVSPAGMACSFGLQVDIVGGNQVVKTFKDKNGATRSISAGKGSALTFPNLDTGAVLSLKPKGSVTHTTTTSNGTTTVVSTGHNVLIFFPTDVPAGPSTTLYVGKVVFTVDNNGVFTLQESGGKAIDLCAALS